MISNYDVYTARMANTYYDKCWWINHIPKNIDIIIDFGCADAGIFEFIDNMYPGRFCYIGFDENEEMLKIAREKYKGNERVSFYRSFKDFKGVLGTNNTIMLLNSVIHELFTYKNRIEIIEFVEDIRNIRPAYIAIRDMHKTIETNEYLSETSLDDIFFDVPGKYSELFLDYKSRTDFGEDDINFFLEFFLKYLYPENWDREVKEKYLWDWSSFLKNTVEKDTKYYCGDIGNYRTRKGYTREYEEDFSIRFLQEKWLKDFGITINVPTHKKVLLRKD